MSRGGEKGQGSIVKKRTKNTGSSDRQACCSAGKRGSEKKKRGKGRITKKGADVADAYKWDELTMGPKLERGGGKSFITEKGRKGRSRKIQLRRKKRCVSRR